MLRCIVGWFRIPDEDWNVTMKCMRDKVTRATNLILLWPWSYYIGDRQWLFPQRIANSDVGIWPRAICSWELLHLANEWTERPFRIQAGQLGNGTMRCANIAKAHLLHANGCMLVRATPVRIGATYLLVSNLYKQLRVCFSGR